MRQVDADCKDEKAQALARLAALQRLKEQAAKGERAGMVKALEQLMNVQGGALRSARDREPNPKA